jgi:hypothetical protein
VNRLRVDECYTVLPDWVIHKTFVMTLCRAYVYTKCGGIALKWGGRGSYLDGHIAETHAHINGTLSALGCGIQVNCKLIAAVYKYLRSATT